MIKKTVYLEKEVAKNIKIQAVIEEEKESTLINNVLKEYVCFMKGSKNNCFSEKEINA